MHLHKYDTLDICKTEYSTATVNAYYTTLYAAEYLKQIVCSKVDTSALSQMFLLKFIKV